MKKFLFTASLVLAVLSLQGQSSLQSKCGCTYFNSTHWVDLDAIVHREVTRQSLTVIEVGIKQIKIRQTGVPELVFPVTGIKKGAGCPQQESRVYSSTAGMGQITVVYKTAYLDDIVEVHLDLPGWPIRVFYK